MARNELLRLTSSDSLVPSVWQGRLAAYVSSEFSSTRPTGEGERALHPPACVCTITRSGFQATNRLDADQLTRALLGVDVNDRDAGGRGETLATQVRTCAMWTIAVLCSVLLVMRAVGMQVEEAKLARLPTALAMRVGEDPKFAEMKKVLLIQVSSTVAARFL